MKNNLVKVISIAMCLLTLAVALIVPISATEETTENDTSNFSITEGNWGTSVYTDLREMVNCTVYPDDINTTNIEERDNSNYYYELSLPVGTVVPWEYFSDMRKGSTYFDGKGQPSAIRAVVGYTAQNVICEEGYDPYGITSLEEKEYYSGYQKMYVYTVGATDGALNPLLKEKNPNASFYFVFSRVDRNSIGAYTTTDPNDEYGYYVPDWTSWNYLAFPCTKTGDDYVIGQGYISNGVCQVYGTSSDYSEWYELAEIKDNKIELWGWQTYNLDGTYTNISDSFYFKLNPSVLGLFKVLDGRTVPYTYLQLIQSYGYDEGYWSGHSEGFDDGLEQGRKNWYQSRYDKGYADAKDVWYKNGLKDGFNGADTSQAWSNMKNLIFAVFDAPFYVISTSLDFNLFGINIAGTLIALISLAIIVWILKIIVVKFF